MITMRRGIKWLLSSSLAAVLALSPIAALAAAEQTVGNATVSPAKTLTAAEAVTKLGVLRGDGDGVTDAYLVKTSTRMQAAILYLRLIGKEQDALNHTGLINFSDAATAGKTNAPVLAYLKSHPELGWNGTPSGKFEPNAAITSQQLYKVMLESLRYKSGSDFAYKDTIKFASSQGLNRAAAAAPFTNRDLAVALTETLQSKPKNGSDSLLKELVNMKVVTAENAKFLDGQRVDIRKLQDGTLYMTDGKGMALYLFTTDVFDLSSCQGKCLEFWPIFNSDADLLLDNSLKADDFGVFTRKEGPKQLTYKGWPLYYFANDKNPGDAKGESVKNWYLMKQPFYTITIGTDTDQTRKLGNYLVDAMGRTLYYFDKDPMGSSVCEGQCLVNWPAFHVESIVVPSSLKKTDFGEIIRPDGTKFTTFKGYPLYYFKPDTTRGEVKGQNVNKVWFVVDPEKFAGTTAGNAAPAKVTIEMKNYAFSTPNITVKPGTTIEFINRDEGMAHNAVAVDGSFKTVLLETGKSATIKLDKEGVFEYYCELHQKSMKGTITVKS
jgi:predicted lipoprotein with Yx(FWY)xxD motif